jgi:uncharacterized membrane protein
VAVIVYLLTLLAPVCWGLTFRQIWPLLGAVPTLALNILADPYHDDNLLAPLGHYSLLAVPFIAVALVGGVASGRCLMTRPRNIVVWSIGLMVLGGGARLLMVQGDQLRGAVQTDDPNRTATLHALSLIPPGAAVLTTHEIAPHLSDRPFVQFIGQDLPPASVDHFDVVLMNDIDQSLHNSPDLTRRLLSDVRSGRYGTFETVYSEDGVTLYRRSGIGWSASGQ